MSNSNPMASQAPAPRPPFPQQHSSYRSDYGAPNGRPSPFNLQSPQMMTYSSPSPQQYSPQQYSQPPAAKRPRLSPDAASPFSTPTYPHTPGGQASSPVGGLSGNGTASAPSRPGLMAPPQRPVEKNSEDRNYDDILAGTGINIEEEARNLVRPDWYGPNTQQNSFQSTSGSFEYQNNSFSRPGSSGSIYNSQHQTDVQSQESQFSAEERLQRDQARADWEAARHSQYPLWDMFLYGGTLNDKIRKISINEHLVDLQAGVMVNTQKQGPPPSARVNGLEGASRYIDGGQAILDTGLKAERLSEVIKLIALATKSRLTGLLGASARLSVERRHHSKGRVPMEWQDLAAVAKSTTDGPENAFSPEGSTSLKRTHSQANSESASQSDLLTGANRVAATLQKVAQAERAAEEARRVKRAKRRAAASADPATADASAESAAEAALAAALDPEKKTTKKERKLAESKFSEQQQHKSANEAARMAVSGVMGNRFGSKKSKTYDWMNKSGGSPAVTPGRPIPSTSTSTVATPAPERPRPQAKDKVIGQWDEDKDPGIQARDVLLVLETDGKAPRSYVRGYSVLDG